MEDSRKLADELLNGNKARMVAVAAGVLLALILVVLLRQKAHILFLVTLLVMLFASVLYGYFLKRMRGSSITLLRRLDLVYIVIEIQLITVLIYLTGGIAWFLSALYFLYLPQAYAIHWPWVFGRWVVFSTPIFSFIALITLGFAGIIPFVSTIPGTNASLARSHIYVVYTLSAFLLTYFYIAYYMNRWNSFTQERSQVLTRAFEELSLERQRVANVVEHLEEGILFIDEAGHIVFVNHKAQEFLGVEARKLLGESAATASRIPNLKSLVELLREPEKNKKKEIQVLDRYSREIILDLAVVPLRAGVRTLGYIITLRDVTREREIDRLRSEFVKMASHRIRSPLSLMKWIFSEFTEGELGELTLDQKAVAKEGLNAVDRLNILVTELLDAVSIEEGKFGYKFIFVSPVPVITAQAELFAKRFSTKNINFWYTIEPDLPALVFDEEKIGIALSNILDNSFWYTYPTGRVELQACKVDNDMVVSVFDNGIGIPEDEKQAIFQKFFRGRLANRINIDGTGLSLYISKNIINGHRGKIWFESKEGQGSTFSFSLPITGGPVMPEQS